MNIAIRISRSYDEIKEWIDKLSLKTASLIAYQHDADEDVSRTHVHLLALQSDILPDALKTRFKKLYGVIDKNDWSFAVTFKDPDRNDVPITSESSPRFITYMSKGHLTPVHSSGYDPERVLELTQQWVQPTKKLTVKNGKFVRQTDDVPEKPKKTRRTLIEMMLDRGKDQNLEAHDTHAVLKMIRQVLIDNNEVVGMWKVMEYYDAWMMYGQEHAWINMIARKIESRNSK